MTKERIQHINDMYDLYRTTPEGVRISLILDKIPRRFSAWVTGEHDSTDSWFFTKKELLVQILEKGFADEPSEEPHCSLT